MDEPLIARRTNLTGAVITELQQRIEIGVYGAGTKLPTELELCREFGVSRTVVREAVASLRLGGRLYSKQGIGVFVTEHDGQKLAFKINSFSDVRTAMEVLELRLSVEVEAVALAAVRKTPAALADITAAFSHLSALKNPSVEELATADFAFHLSVSRATGNPHFPQFLEALGEEICSDLLRKHGHISGSPEAKLKRMIQEHAGILAAIVQGDATAARKTMRNHLEKSLLRYRRLLEIGHDGV